MISGCVEGTGMLRKWGGGHVRGTVGGHVGRHVDKLEAG